MITKTVVEMDYIELEELVQKTYGLKKRWSFVADQELNNDSCQSFDFTEKEELEEFDKADLELFIAKDGFKNWMAPILMQDMVNRDILPLGNYVIEVCW
jgi:hypothetical protein